MKELIMSIIKSIQTDKLEHFLVNAVIVMALGSLRFLIGNWALLIAVVASAFVSLYKEYKCDSYVDKKDIVADALGMLLGIMVYVLYIL